MVSVSGRKIKEYRETARLTQEELAERVLVSRVAITHYEIGVKKPTAETLKRIADCFGVSMEDLMESA